MFPNARRHFIEILAVGTHLIPTGVMPAISTREYIDKRATHNNVINQIEYINYELVP